jgi:hypothetical protein
MTIRNSHLPMPRNLAETAEDDRMVVKVFLENLGDALFRHAKKQNPAAKLWNLFTGNKGTRLVLQWKTHPIWKTPDSQFLAQAYPMADGTFEIRVEYSYMYEGDGFDRDCSVNFDPMSSVRPEVLIYQVIKEVSRWDLAMHRTGGLVSSEEGLRVAASKEAYVRTEGVGSPRAAASAIKLAIKLGPKLSHIRQIWQGARPV